jgi:hypothetical protein
MAISRWKTEPASKSITHKQWLVNRGKGVRFSAFGSPIAQCDKLSTFLIIDDTPGEDLLIPRLSNYTP